MARFFASIINGTSRHTETTVGGRSSVDSAHIRGWDAGIKVVCVKLADGDAFDVYQTGGSHASTPDVFLGKLFLTRGMAAPRWEPAGDAMSEDAMTYTPETEEN
jgi:hypothetical protein